MYGSRPNHPIPMLQIINPWLKKKTVLINIKTLQLEWGIRIISKTKASSNRSNNSNIMSQLQKSIIYVLFRIVKKMYVSFY